MSQYEVVENPRRKRRKAKRRLSRKQIAAGFGGKRRRSTRKSAPRRRRRNPALATLAANPRRRKRRSQIRTVRGRVVRRKRHRNPGLLGNFDLKSSLFVGGGMVGVRAFPNLLGRAWVGMPRTGITGYAVKVGGVVVLGMVTKLVFKSNQRAAQVTAGAVGLLLFDAFNEFVAPKIGLAGLSDGGGFVSGSELDAVLSGGVSGFIETPSRLGLNGFVTQDEVLAA